MFDLVKPKPQVPAIVTRLDARTNSSKQVAVRPVEVLPAGRAATPEFRLRLQREEAELRAAASVRARLRVSLAIANHKAMRPIHPEFGPGP